MQINKTIIGVFITLFISGLAIGILYKTKLSQFFFINKKCDKCNVVLIDIDTLRADELPCYGYFRDTAPNLCKFAKKSVIFKNNYSVSNWTLPDIFSTITGQYPTFHRVESLPNDRLPGNIPTLAETLKQNGYQTIMVGHTIQASQNDLNGGFRGYDKVINDEGMSLDNLISELSNSPKPWFVHYYREDLHLPYLIKDSTDPIDTTQIAPKNLPIYWDDFNFKLNRYLKTHYSDIFQRKALDEFGSIIMAPNRSNDTELVNLFHKFGEGINPQDYIKDYFKPIFNTYIESFNTKDPSDVRYVRMMYDTQIRNLDQKLSKLFETLGSGEISKNTVTIVMSNHGEEFGEHGGFNHFEDNYHSELYQTPLIIHSPFFNEKQVEQTSSNIDIFPTILELIGINLSTIVQGTSLLPIITDENYAKNRFVLGYSSEGKILQNKNWLYYLPNNDTKIENSILYDKTNDPTESTNVASKYPVLISELHEKLLLINSYENITRTSKNVKDNTNFINLDPEKVKRLQKEGYF